MNSASVSDSRPVREIYDLGDQPPLGVVPEKMHAFCVRQERFGEPKEAWQREIIPIPTYRAKRCIGLHDGYRDQLQQCLGGAGLSRRRDC